MGKAGRAVGGVRGVTKDSRAMVRRTVEGFWSSDRKKASSHSAPVSK